jgi:DNA-binding MarR family transcriptional regulator
LLRESTNKLPVRQENEDNMDSYDNLGLWRLFFTAKSSVSRVRDLELAAIGVTPEQSGALFLLANRGKSTIGQMANAWIRQRNSVSTLLDRMEKQGLVKKNKIPKQKDLEVCITPKGREMHNRILATGQVLDTIFNKFSEEDRQDFIRCMKKVISSSQASLVVDNMITQIKNTSKD